MHVHLEVDDCGHKAMPEDLFEASAAYFKSAERTPSVDRIAEVYREAKMAAVLFTVDARTALGHAPNSIDDLVAGAARNNDVLIPFGSVDPRTGSDAIAEARRQANDLGVRGFKFHPSLQGFDPSSEEFYPLWAALEELGLPCIFHTGQNGMGAGLPGGRGIKLRYSNPLLLDDVAADFPGLTIIMAHPSVPWQDEANSIATHKANVFIDLSGWSPKYFPASLVKMSNNVLSTKVLFGTDYPLITPEKWLGAFAELPLKDEVRPLILKDNAARRPGADCTVTGFYPSDQLGFAGLLTDAERAALLRLRAVLDEHVRPVVNEYWERGEFPEQITGPLVGLGMMEPAEVLGGRGEGPRTLCRLPELRAGPRRCLGRHVLQRPVRALPDHGEPGRQRSSRRPNSTRGSAPTISRACLR